jgi:hypothetical protein
MRGLAINVGANTNEPGFRGPITGDGYFTYLPIPESEPTAGTVPTYGDLHAELGADIPEDVHDRPVHLDPSFPTYPFCDAHTYGDEHGIKAGPISDLSAGDYLFFYATLTTEGEAADWVAPEWGAYLIGHFRLAADPVTDYEAAPPDLREPLSGNAHRKRATPDERVLVLGDGDESALYDHAVPLSAPDAGADANRLVTEVSSDSGKGPWWRRPMRFDAEGTETLLSVRANGAYDRCFRA